MGNKQTIQKVNFEDIQNILSSHNNNILLINTLKNNKEAQNCILPQTIHFLKKKK